MAEVSRSKAQPYVNAFLIAQTPATKPEEAIGRNPER